MKELDFSLATTEEILKELGKRAKEKRDIQWVIYSAHDTTVGNMLAAMNMTNVDCIFEAFTQGNDSYNSDKCVIQYPGYTASIIFEVY